MRFFRVYDNSEYDLYKRVAAIKNSDPNVKVLISYGGWNFGSWAFTVPFCHFAYHYIMSLLFVTLKN